VTLQLTKSEKKVLVFFVILIPLIFAFLYFNYLNPLMTNVKSKELQLDSNQQVYNAVLNEKSGIQETIVEKTELLQKRLPVKPLIDHFILDLEKAELLSDSVITQMDFSADEAEEGTTSIGDAINGGSGLNENNYDSESQKTLAEGNNSTPIAKLPVNLTIQSPSYFSLEKFLVTIESLERIITVESISFSGQPEQQQAVEPNSSFVQPEQQETVESNILSGQSEQQQAVEQNSFSGQPFQRQAITPITYQVSLSLYYMPTLVDLQNELPKIETGEPANKINPLK
jgi:type IV pilus assembly protein PilO